ncbi:hypothetical protein V6N13_123943 [Hibiscus sabdariffa]
MDDSSSPCFLSLSLLFLVNKREESGLGSTSRDYPFLLSSALSSGIGKSRERGQTRVPSSHRSKEHNHISRCGYKRAGPFLQSRVKSTLAEVYIPILPGSGSEAEFLPHTARAEDRGKFRRDGETQQLPVGVGISL